MYIFWMRSWIEGRIAQGIGIGGGAPRALGIGNGIMTHTQSME